MPDTPRTPNEVAAQRRCGFCRHFQNAPSVIEAAFPGLTAMSSGSASVRAQDGLCALHDRYLSFRDSCNDFDACPR
jgi:hypothetical protein